RERRSHRLGTGRARPARRVAPGPGAALRPGRRPGPGSPVEHGVGAPRAHDPAHLADRARSEGRVGRAGGRPGARRLGPRARAPEPPAPLVSRERPSSRPPAPRNPGRAPARGAGHPARAALAALALAFALLPAGCRSRSPALIGLAGPLRDPAGAPMRRAAELAVDEINAGGGVGGRPLALVERDDFGNPDSATAVAAAFYRSRVSAVVGHLFASQ